MEKEITKEFEEILDGKLDEFSWYDCTQLEKQRTILHLFWALENKIMTPPTMKKWEQELDILMKRHLMILAESEQYAPFYQEMKSFIREILRVKLREYKK